MFSLIHYPCTQAWAQNQSTFVVNVVDPLMTELFPPLLRFVMETLHTETQCLEVFYIRQFCDLYQVMLNDNVSSDRLTNLTVMSLTWSLGALLSTDERQKFHLHFRKIAPDLDLPPGDAFSSETIFDYRVDDNGNVSSMKLFYLNPNLKLYH